ncbi:hypothetical protein TSUD_10000 [Trifolium subterraneum]|nr:hypothetical protein TSUD_10000 [Trifolium subterraneum]
MMTLTNFDQVNARVASNSHAPSTCFATWCADLIMASKSQVCKLVVVATNAAMVPPQLYWKSMLPNIPMPKAITNLLPPENILDKFSIKKGSKEYEIVKNTINECEEKGIKGEKKLCVTSLESMIEFATSKLGNNVEAISTEVEKESNELQEYVIAKGVKKLGEDNKVVVCHKMNYLYAVFTCHKIDATNAYSVPLEGVDGNRVEVAAVCHTDTSQFYPKHISFQIVMLLNFLSFELAHLPSVQVSDQVMRVLRRRYSRSRS